MRSRGRPHQAVTGGVFRHHRRSQRASPAHASEVGTPRPCIAATPSAPGKGGERSGPCPGAIQSLRRAEETVTLRYRLGTGTARAATVCHRTDGGSSPSRCRSGIGSPIAAGLKPPAYVENRGDRLIYRPGPYSQRARSNAPVRGPRRAADSDSKRKEVAGILDKVTPRHVVGDGGSGQIPRIKTKCQSAFLSDSVAL